MSNDTRIAVDVAKAVFELAISDRAGHVARRERLPRALFLAFMAQQPAATVVIEACGSAHHWAVRNFGTDSDKKRKSPFSPGPGWSHLHHTRLELMASP